MALSYFLLDLRAQPRTSFFSFICQHVKMSVMKIITEREGREHSKPINCKPQVFDIFQKQPSKIQYPFFSISNDNHCDIIGKEGFENLKDAISFLSMIYTTMRH